MDPSVKDNDADTNYVLKCSLHFPWAAHTHKTIKLGEQLFTKNSPPYQSAPNKGLSTAK